MRKVIDVLAVIVGVLYMLVASILWAIVVLTYFGIVGIGKLAKWVSVWMREAASLVVDWACDLVGAPKTWPPEKPSS